MSNVTKLPDSYAKESSSNNYKLLYLNEQAIADVKADAQALLESLDLAKATGHTLDLYGEIVGQKRGLLKDEQYYYMILTKLGANGVQGDYKSVVNALSLILGCEKSQIIIEDSVAACKVDLVSIPLSGLVFAGYSSRQAVAMIEKLLPIGVSVNDANFDGTFEFADTEDVYDETAGFANLEQTIGGHLGLLLGDDDTIPILPI